MVFVRTATLLRNGVIFESPCIEEIDLAQANEKRLNEANERIKQESSRIQEALFNLNGICPTQMTLNVQSDGQMCQDALFCWCPRESSGTRSLPTGATVEERDG